MSKRTVLNTSIFSKSKYSAIQTFSDKVVKKTRKKVSNSLLKQMNQTTLALLFEVVMSSQTR